MSRRRIKPLFRKPKFFRLDFRCACQKHGQSHFFLHAMIIQQLFSINRARYIPFVRGITLYRIQNSSPLKLWRCPASAHFVQPAPATRRWASMLNGTVWNRVRVTSRNAGRKTRFFLRFCLFYGKMTSFITRSFSR